MDVPHFHYSLEVLATAVTAIAVLTVMLAALDLAAESWANPLDTFVSRQIISHRKKRETYFMHVVSWFGGPIGIPIFASLSVLFLTYSQTFRVGTLFFTGLATALLYVLVVKLITARKRPSLKVLEVERTFSFPSAHTMLSTTAYGSLFAATHGLHFDWAFTSLLSLLILIGVSRIYLGCHYLSDVLAGLVGGSVWVGLFVFLLTRS